MTRRSGWLAVLAAGVVFVLAWKVLVVVAGYPAYFLPAPEVVVARFVQAAGDGTLAPHVIATLTEVAAGLLAGGGIALIAGYALARSRFAERVLSPYLVAAQATPILALAPLIALWFGTGLLSKVIICAVIVFFPIAVSTMVGVRSVDAGLLELARLYRATRWQRIRDIEIPAALPQVFGGLRIGVTLAVVGAVVGEWAGAERGLGVLINLARGSAFDTPLLFATLLSLALIGVALYAVTVAVEHRLVGERA